MITSISAREHFLRRLTIEEDSQRTIFFSVTDFIETILIKQRHVTSTKWSAKEIFSAEKVNEFIQAKIEKSIEKIIFTSEAPLIFYFINSTINIEVCLREHIF